MRTMNNDPSAVVKRDSHTPLLNVTHYITPWKSAPRFKNKRQTIASSLLPSSVFVPFCLTEKELYMYLSRKLNRMNQSINQHQNRF